jgi:hypothetical protein
MPGGFPSISAHRMENGVLWAALLMQDDAWIDINFAKYAPPTVANSKVYLATFFRLRERLRAADRGLVPRCQR